MNLLEFGLCVWLIILSVVGIYAVVLLKSDRLSRSAGLSRSARDMRMQITT